MTVRMLSAVPLALSAAFLLACTMTGTVDDEVVVPDPFARAVELAGDENEKQALAALEQALVKSAGNVQRALLEPAFHEGLRDLPEFRAAIHRAAVAHEIHRLTLAPKNEPGEWIEVTVRIVDAKGEPVPGAVARLFATDDSGRYHPTLAGERVPRLFAVLVADERGRFVFRTVRPGPYPGTRNPRHVHIAVRAGDLRLAVPGYIVFDDDPLLFEPGNEEPRGEAVRIAMKQVDGRAKGTVELPLRKRATP